MRGERFIQAEIAHDGGDQRIVAQLAGAQKIDSGNGEDFVTIDNLAVVVAEQDAIGIAVVSDADIGVAQLHGALNFLRVRAAATVVNIHAVRLIVNNGDIGAELAQDARRRFVSGAVGHIDSDTHFFERHFSGETRLGEFNVAAKRVVDARGASDFAGGRPD